MARKPISGKYEPDAYMKCTRCGTKGPKRPLSDAMRQVKEHNKTKHGHVAPPGGAASAIHV